MGSMIPKEIKYNLHYDDDGMDEASLRLIKINLTCMLAQECATF